MKEDEFRRMVNEIAIKTADMVCERLQISYEKPEWINANQAAEILGLSPLYIRQIKDKFVYIKKGDSKQSRVLYKRESVENALKEYAV